MIKRSSSRNQRSKGIKLKHVLQIMLLLAVCFWLIYQVKRSHHNKNEFDHTHAEVSSVANQNAYQNPNLLGGRRAHPGEDKVNQDQKHKEQEQDDSIVEDEDKLEHEEEINEHDNEEKEPHKPRLTGAGEEQAEDEYKSQEMEDEIGVGDEEIDENDQDKPDVDADRDDDFMENENTQDEGKDASVENHNNHEAREENYKGDDASSAVTHDTRTTTAETEIVNLENSEMSITNKPNSTEDSNRNQPGSDLKITQVKLTDETSSNATSVEETGNDSVSNPLDSSNLNNISMTSSDNHSEASGNLTVVIPGASNNMTVTNTPSEHNRLEMFSESTPAQNDTVNITVNEDAKNVQTGGLEQVPNSISEENHPGSNLTVPVKTENGAASGAESSNVEGGDIDKATRLVAYNETENKGNSEMSEISKTQNNSYVKENTGATKEEEFNFKGTTQISDSSSANGTSDSVEHHAIDSHILKEVTEVRTDPDTLPNIRNVGDNGDAAATA